MQYFYDKNIYYEILLKYMWYYTDVRFKRIWPSQIITLDPYYSAPKIL